MTRHSPFKFESLEVCVCARNALPTPVVSLNLLTEATFVCVCVQAEHLCCKPPRTRNATGRCQAGSLITPTLMFTAPHVGVPPVGWKP